MIAARAFRLAGSPRSALFARFSDYRTSASGAQYSLEQSEGSHLLTLLQCFHGALHLLLERCDFGRLRFRSTFVLWSERQDIARRARGLGLLMTFGLSPGVFLRGSCSLGALF